MSRGGFRTGAGRPSRGGGPGKNYTFRMPDEIRAELTDGLQDGETLASLIIDASLAVVRRRKVPA